MLNWPKFLGTFQLCLPTDSVHTPQPTTTILTLNPDHPTYFDGKINCNELNNPLLCGDEYFADINHYYQEIWNFLIPFKLISVQVIIHQFDAISGFILHFHVYLLENVLNFANQDSDLNYLFLSKEKLKPTKQEAIQQQELQILAKESFIILCDLLQIHCSIKAELTHQQGLLEQLMVQKYKTKSLDFKVHLMDKLIIPTLICNQYPKYYSKYNLKFITDEHLKSLQKSILDENTNNSQQLFQTNDNDDILSISEQKSKQFTQCQQPSQLTVKLFPYQAQGVQWMLYKEDKITAQQLNISNQFTYNNSKIAWSQLELPNGELIYFNEFSGQFKTEFTDNRSIKGGILADQMGLGKTIMAIALILFQRELEQEPIKKIKTNLIKAQTLLIVQKSIFGHWIDQLKQCTLPNTLQVFEYYSMKSRDKSIQLDVYDVVITTYNVLGKDYQKDKTLQTYYWNRIILDEAHIIKGRGALCSKAAYNLSSDIRWCLTGTPLQNSLEDLFSLFHFLQIDTFSNYYCFNNYINKEENPQIKYNLLHKVLDPIILRRSKNSTYLDGTPMLSLPKKHIKIEYIKLNQEESQIYDIVFKNAKSELEKFKKSNFRECKINFQHVFQRIRYLRQICDSSYMFIHKISKKDQKNQQQNNLQIEDRLRIFLREEQNQKEIQELSEDISIFQESEQEEEQIQEEKNENQKINMNYIEALIKDIKGGKAFEECCICVKSQYQWYIMSCGHLICKICSDQGNIANCPFCRKPITNLKLIQNNTYFYTPSSKLNEILNEVKRIQQSKEKVAIFTQWRDILKFFMFHFKKMDYDFQMLHGSMNMEQRNSAIKKFQETDCQIILISIKVGAYGINLTAANHVLIVDSWWNPALEYIVIICRDQAIERVHRLGQDKEIFVKIYACRNTIEERVLELQRIKRKIFQDALQLKFVNDDKRSEKEYKTEFLLE